MFAVAAIPIWFAKINIILAALKIFTTLCRTGIQWITNKIEDLMFFDFASLFSGNKKQSSLIINYDGNTDSFHFFPSASSPFFILWIVFLSATMLMIIIMILWILIKRFNPDEWNEGITHSGASIFASFATIIVAIFFVPVTIFSTMTISSEAVKALFKSSDATVNQNQVKEFNSNIANQLDKAAEQIYYVGDEITLDQSDNGQNALYSHTYKDTNDDIDYQKDNNSPFSSTQSIFERLSLELNYLDKAADNFNSSFQLTITQSNQAISDYVKKWYSTNDLKNIITYLASSASSVGIDTKDIDKSSLISDKVNTLSTYVSETVSLFNQLSSIVVENKNIITDLNLDSTWEITNKIASLFNDINPTKEINWINNQTNLSDNEENSAQEAIAFANIYSLTKVYLAPFNYLSINDWKQSYAFPSNMAYTNEKSLMDVLQNITKMIIGYNVGNDNISLTGLSWAYASHKESSLSEVVGEISNSGSGNIFVSIAMIVVSWAVVGMILGILYQIVKRLLERLFKLLWLWISGGILLISGAGKGVQSLKIWFSMTITEMTMLVGLCLGWFIWKSLTPIIFDWIGGTTPYNTLISIPIAGMVNDGINASNSIGPILFKIFVALGLLELVVLCSDWLKTSMGGSPSFANIRNNIAGKSSSTAKNSFNRSRVSMQKTDQTGTAFHNKIAESNWGRSRGMKTRNRTFGSSSMKGKK